MKRPTRAAREGGKTATLPSLLEPQCLAREASRRAAPPPPRTRWGHSTRPHRRPRRMPRHGGLAVRDARGHAVAPWLPRGPVPARTKFRRRSRARRRVLTGPRARARPRLPERRRRSHRREPGTDRRRDRPATSKATPRLRSPSFVPPDVLRSAAGRLLLLPLAALLDDAMTVEIDLHQNQRHLTVPLTSRTCRCREGVSAGLGRRQRARLPPPASPAAAAFRAPNIQQRRTRVAILREVTPRTPGTKTGACAGRGRYRDGST